MVLSMFLLAADGVVYGITKFMEYAATEIDVGSRLLDAGAGDKPYKKCFRHTAYESADLEGNHDLICDVDNIPVDDCTYDVVVSTQVLEHVKAPLDVLKEFNRILKRGGKLFLTAPQGFGIHGEYCYFNFLRQGLEKLLSDAGFMIISVKPLGGLFWVMGKYLRIWPWCIYRQYVFRGRTFHPTLGAFVLAPFFILVFPFCRYLIPWLCFYLDRLDKAKDWTLTYGCYAVKP